MSSTSDEATRRSELITYFGDSLKDNQDIMQECLSICRLYSLPPSELFYKHEAYILSRPSTSGTPSGTGITLQSARDVKAQIQREMVNKTTNGSATGAHGADGTGTPVIARKLGAVKDIGGFLDALATPSRPSTASHTTPKPRFPTSTPLPSRTNATASSSTTATTAASYATPQRHPMNGRLETPMNAKFGSSPGEGGSDSPLVSTPRPSQPFSHRPNPFELLETLNSHLSPAPGVPYGATKQRIKLSASSNPKDWDYRYMFEKISERSEALDTMIDEFAVGFQEGYGIGELSDPGLISEEPVYVVGRIISLPTDTGKPTDSSLLLESSRAMGNGRRVPLRFGNGVKVRGGSPGVKGFGVFAGCLVGLKGRNGGGGVFVVEEVMLPPPADMPSTSASQLLRYQHDLLNGEPTSVIVAAGPYTLDSDLLFEPLEALLEAAKNDRPDVLILLGPFIDSSHPLVKVGDLDETPTEIFRNQVASRLSTFTEDCPATAVIVIPSVRDMVSRHVAFPQAMLEKSPELGLPKRVRLLPNPSTFYINEIMFSLCSVDVLFHLRKEEYFRRAEEAEVDVSVEGRKGGAGPAAKDSMAELCRHVLGQKSFYPLFPPPEDLAADVNLDVTHQHLIRMDDKAPDVLILPSRLKHFAKIVDSVVTVNPSYLAKSSTAGTYCKLAIHPQNRAELQDAAQAGVEQEHKAFERVRVDVMRV